MNKTDSDKNTAAGGKKKIALVTTGGTIAQRVDSEVGGAVPALTGEEILKTVPKLKEYADFTVVPVVNIDSRDMNFQIYCKLAHKLKKLSRDGGIDAIVILHGTDTMEETAFFLNQVIKAEKPIAITGAMRSASERDADGPRNLIDTVRVLLTPYALNGNIMVVMNGNIINGLAVTKVDSSNIDAFNGGKHGVLGIIDEFHVTWYNKPININTFKIPQRFPKVDIVLAYPGASGNLIKASVRDGAKGIVIVGYGAGNVSKQLFRTIRSVLKNKKDFIFLISTRSPEGNILPVYAGEGGAVDLEKLGVVLGGSLNPTKSRILLMLCLCSSYPKSRIISIFQKSEIF
ncbi:MAG: asparaginase [Victivallales bacterium]|nr:asparaginase [Victivallales bacterium]